MKKLNLFFFLFFCFAIGFSQNLVPNPSFEDFSDCPHNMTQIQLASPWFQPISDPPNGSSDYFNLCDSTLGGVWYFYQTQMPRSGNGMAGIMFYTSPNASAEIREYIEIKLDKPLTKNTSYCISYYVSLIGYSTYAIDAICSCLTVDSLMCQQSNVYLLPCPNMACNNEGSIIKDTLNWVKVTMNFVSQGGEQFVTVGNFKTTPQTNAVFISLTYGWATYYFIDDVAVYECNTPEYPANTPDQKPCKGETVTLGSQTRPQYLYEWKDAAGNVISDQGSITIVADTSTYYVLKQKDFKFDETTDTCFITVDPFCLHIPNVITPNNDGINDFFVIERDSNLKINLQLFNRWGKLVFESSQYQNNWPTHEIADGVYFYVVKATSAAGEVREYQGSVSVLR